MTIQQYIENIHRKFKVGNTTEHTFRGNLENLIVSLMPTVMATNEPTRQQCGSPDYILTNNKGITLGYIEAKDIGDKDLDGQKLSGNKEQFDRYKSLNNIIFTDYLAFHLYRDGQFVKKIAIGKVQNNTIEALPENFDEFTDLIKSFCTNIGQSIKSSKKLSEMMAGKARLLSNIIERALTSDETHNENGTPSDSTLKDQMKAFKDILIHDITPEGFADIYAQTITYGLFAARLHDPTLPTFSRQEAAELIPKTNPFLRKLFGYIAGPDLDDRILWIVDDLVEIFLACNVAELLKDYGKTTGMEDPIIHFYENFLSEYDPALRKARGVWYTPKPVVNFIVRAVDEILKTEFNLPQGLADTSKTSIKVQTQTFDNKTKKYKEIEQEVHKVQILDPATGTGTFLAEVVKHIHKKFKGQTGLWSKYVSEHLIPRLNGFELLMASYAMAHLQLDLLLTETGYKSPLTPRGGISTERLRIFLTNSLEEHHPDTGTLFANWLSSEANEANHIKRDTPVMCVIGNPPYAVSSTNKNEWILNLIADYKKELNERKINLDDDYIKFIRFGQHFIDKNGEGILAYISNNSFIDGITHRQMRKHLLESFDTVYILDLHGNAKKKEVALDGSADQNVFDIMQGVSINIFVKTGKKKEKELGKVFYHELRGKRDYKYQFLHQSSFKTIEWTNLEYTLPNLFFVPKNFDEFEGYNKGVILSELFNIYSVGIETQRDSVTIQFDKSKIKEIVMDFKNIQSDDIRRKYKIDKDGRDWQIETAKTDTKLGGNYCKIFYRPFDLRDTYFTGKSKGFMAYPRGEVMNNLFEKNNISLIVCKQQSTFDFQHIFVTKNISDGNSISIQTKERANVFPLYLYPDQTGQLNFGANTARTPNLNPTIIQQMVDGLGIAFEAEKTHHSSFNTQNSFAPIDVLDYIYAVLHSPNYREKYKEFLKIDFPRVPYPRDLPTFQKLVNLGGQIRQIHLLESSVVEEYITEYPIAGDDKVGKIVAKATEEHFVRVYINESQYFDKVPKIAWEFYIGGYQPAQKWLKDRKDRTLNFEDILHYQKIIVALNETDRLMKEIDLVGVE
ncbi:type ISP restriction/modification enzyme [Arcicella rosea]|uniref:site-specific DNA-methyltransferase (adenine-specific) n=1 Tax=Arcicella rosea TaxID=502909 RepID=A0A841ESE1_9BACT|nr:type ISP restriction/modification enzyme [Arcicella rosea]MBB6004319.1 putative helicase [Arcicella rosea]